MRLRFFLPAVIALLLAVGWTVDRSHLARQLTSLQRDLNAREMLEDKAEFELFDRLEPGDTAEEHPTLRIMADDSIQQGHQGFGYCTAFLTEHFADVSANFDDCEILVFDIAPDAVPYCGGSYWIVIRDDCIVLAFAYMTIIGG